MANKKINNINLKTKTKMTISNRDFCHQYAYASTDNQEYHNGNMSYYNGIMLSYNTAIAKKLDNCTLYNSTSYSVSTSGQQSCLRNALSGKIIWLDGLDRGNRFEKHEIIAGLTCSLNWSLEKLAKAKRDHTKERFAAEVHGHFNTLQDLIKYKVLLKKDLNKELTALLKKEQDPLTIGKMVKIKAKQQADEKKRQLKRLEEKRKDYQQEVDDFRAGKIDHISYSARDLICKGFDIIRLVNDGKEILTAQNIKVPIDHALYLLKHAQTQRQLNESSVDFNYRIKDQFPIDKIDEKGNCFVGCHKFEFSEILRCYTDEYLRRNTDQEIEELAEIN